ncbi:unnamed protein product [Brassicogethes aeneus]|uniref:Uncharacterized protein n=1 Tax=Brassicogethes aeneus TaxID=1431903 RepID=A0A9P0BAA7_BRAAE|nr:unnamed protein product [Brassicogethes aeneus]
MPPKAAQSCQSCTNLTEIINELKNVINALKSEVESLKSKVEELGKNEQIKGYRRLPKGPTGKKNIVIFGMPELTLTDINGRKRENKTVASNARGYILPAIELSEINPISTRWSAQDDGVHALEHHFPAIISALEEMEDDIVEKYSKEALKNYGANKYEKKNVTCYGNVTNNEQGLTEVNIDHFTKDNYGCTEVNIDNFEKDNYNSTEVNVNLKRNLIIVNSVENNDFEKNEINNKKENYGFAKNNSIEHISKARVSTVRIIDSDFEDDVTDDQDEDYCLSEESEDESLDDLENDVPARNSGNSIGKRVLDNINRTCEVAINNKNLFVNKSRGKTGGKKQSTEVNIDNFEKDNYNPTEVNVNLGKNLIIINPVQDNDFEENEINNEKENYGPTENNSIKNISKVGVSKVGIIASDFEGDCTDDQDMEYCLSEVSEDELLDELENDVPAQNSGNSIKTRVLDNMNRTCEVAINDENLVVNKSRGKKGDKKQNFCVFCHTKQQKISRYLEMVHKNKSEVQKFMSLPKRCEERKILLGDIRKRGNFLYNTNKCYNDGELIVSRRPNQNSQNNARDYLACAKCKGFFSKKSIRKHFSQCSNLNSASCRNVLKMSKRVTGRIHSKANEVVKKFLLPSIRDDTIGRMIRFDELIIIYANRMCQKYPNTRHHEMIRQRMRLLGRFLYAVKIINKEIHDLASVFDPKFLDICLQAIRNEAKYDADTGIFEVPSVAFSLGTLLKQTCNFLITESIKNHDPIKRVNAEDFLKLMAEEMNLDINRVASESQIQSNRNKKVELPPMEDIKKLHSYLNKKRQDAVGNLKSMISYANWLNLAEFTLSSIQVFNRRRAGEVERILIQDFKKYQGLNPVENKDLYKTMSENDRKRAGKYVRFAIRGKLNRTVSVLIDASQLECLNLMLKVRSMVGICEQNPYLFGVPGNKPFKFLRACILMRKFSVDCGALYPKRLRGTELRKHIATTCITLNLEDEEVTDLANYMGHAEKIHKEIYRQPLVNREILRMSQLLNRAQGDNSDNEEGEEYGITKFINNDINMEQDNNDINMEQDNNDINMKRDIDINNLTKTSNLSTSRTSQRSPMGYVKRKRWSFTEKEIILREFSDQIENKKLPSLKQIQSVIVAYPELRSRTAPKIKTWIHNQYKKK